MELAEALSLRQNLVTLANNKDNTAQVLKALEGLANVELSKQVLEDSKLGVEVNRLRKSRQNDQQVVSKATELLLKWRDVVLEQEGSTRSKREAAKEQPEKGKDALESQRDQLSPTKELKRQRQEMTEVQIKESMHSIVSSSSPTSAKILSSSCMTGDVVRDKCFDMLVTALCIDQDDSHMESKNQSIMKLARSIEKCLFSEFGQANQGYKTKFRSKYLNLKEKANLHLRNALIDGTISAERFCSMTPAEMASKERREQDRLLIERNLQEAKAVQDNEAETDQFKCGRCHQRRTKYYQLQTRSADEPMTTFVTCINCGNRWKSMTLVN